MATDESVQKFELVAEEYRKRE